MASLVIDLADDVLAKLESVAPGESRQQSQFVAKAIQKALWDLEERRTEEVYRRQPDSLEDAFDPEAWEPR